MAALADAELSSSHEESTPPIRWSGEPWEWWRSLGSPVHVCSPMVDHSELAYRQLIRRHYLPNLDENKGAGILCYTPMLHAKKFATDATYRAQRFVTCPEELAAPGGLIAQFCGDDARSLLAAAKLVQSSGISAVDLNLGW